jgi:hypothetical protein
VGFNHHKAMSAALISSKGIREPMGSKTKYNKLPVSQQRTNVGKIKRGRMT